MKELMASTFQTNGSFTGGYDECKNQNEIVNELHGFAGVCCSKKQL